MLAKVCALVEGSCVSKMFQYIRGTNRFACYCAVRTSYTYTTLIAPVLPDALFAHMKYLPSRVARVGTT